MTSAWPRHSRKHTPYLLFHPSRRFWFLGDGDFGGYALNLFNELGIACGADPFCTNTANSW